MFVGIDLLPSRDQGKTGESDGDGSAAGWIRPINLWAAAWSTRARAKGAPKVDSPTSKGARLANDRTEAGTIARTDREDSRSKERGESIASWVGIAAVAVGASLLYLLGGRTPSPKATAPAEEVKLPQPLEPAGELESAPLRFVWEPGGEDVDLSQVILFRGDLSRFWETAPVETSEVTVPLHAFDGIYPMEPCYWRVREVTDGRPRAASVLKGFKIKNPPRPPPAEKFAE
jgi:hypothetical protein